jgi:hypothetical protein
MPFVVVRGVVVGMGGGRKLRKRKRKMLEGSCS